MSRFTTMRFYACLGLFLPFFLVTACCAAQSGAEDLSEAANQEKTKESSTSLEPEEPAPGVIGENQVFTPEQLKADLNFLYTNLQKAHVNLFIHTPKSEYDSRHRQMRSAFNRPLSPFEAATQFQRFMALGRIGHSRIEFPHAAYEAYRSGGGKTAPFFFRVKHDRVFITESYSDADLRLGDEILALDGMAISAWLKRLAANISSESAYMSHSLLEFWFPRLLWLELGEVDFVTLDVRSIDTDSAKRRLKVKMLGVEEIRTAAKTVPPRLELDWNARSAKMLDGGVAYLRPGPFYQPESTGGYDPTAFRQFIDSSFESFLEHGAKRLLIDVRDNPGGDNSFSDLMISWFADRPFRFCSAFRIKVSEQTRSSHRSRLEMNPNLEGPSRAFTELYANNPNGSLVDFEMPYAEPREGKRFEGEVYLLINRHSFSNTVTVAALVQDYDLGIVIGEKTSDLATSYGAMEHFLLPATGFRVGYPKAHLVRPNGDERLRGVTPDIAIDSPLIQGPDDPVLQEALAVIEKRRSITAGRQ